MRDINSGRFLPTHLMTGSSEYGIWGNMLYRCNTETSPLYHLYGGRGVSVSDSWNSFDTFISDMGKRPSDGHSIDRIDVNGNYCKENCRWATKKEQSRNRTNSVYIFIDGRKLQVDDYCEIYGVSKMAIKNRVRRGWSNDRIISTKVRSNKNANS